MMGLSEDEDREILARFV